MMGLCEILLEWAFVWYSNVMIVVHDYLSFREECILCYPLFAVVGHNDFLPLGVFFV